MSQQFDEIDETRAMRVKSAADSGFCIINREDFDPGVHERFYLPGQEPVVTPNDPPTGEELKEETKTTKKTKK